MWNGRNLGCSSHIFVIVNGGNIEHNKRWVLDIRKASLKKLKNIWKSDSIASDPIMEDGL